MKQITKWIKNVAVFFNGIDYDIVLKKSEGRYQRVAISTTKELALDMARSYRANDGCHFVKRRKREINVKHGAGNCDCCNYFRESLSKEQLKERALRDEFSALSLKMNLDTARPEERSRFRELQRLLKNAEGRS